VSARGFASLGLFNPKDHLNVGGALRAAACYEAALVAVQGERYRKSSTDTTSAWRHVPTIHTDDLISSIPLGAVPVAIEFIKTARPLTGYVHPESAFYIFGPEDGSISKRVLDQCRDVVYVPTSHCMNLAATVNVVLYDRLMKRGGK
jgi:tRNA(Leu) C34 or U34 (ribose-2'-O)-methylase TrmL